MTREELIKAITAWGADKAPPITGEDYLKGKVPRWKLNSNKRLQDEADEYRPHKTLPRNPDPPENYFHDRWGRRI